MALAAVSLALSEYNDDVLSSSPYEGNERVDELVIELTWIKCFLVDNERTLDGRTRSEVWSTVIERLAICARDLRSTWVDPTLKALGIERLNKKFANLREKLQPFVVSNCGASSYVAKSIPYTAPTVQLSKEIKVKAWGGAGGQKWDYRSNNGMLQQIVIVHGIIIDSITFTSVNSDGNREIPAKFGGSGGSSTTHININGPSEYLIGISGTYGVFNYCNVIISLEIYTSTRQYGPIGSKNGTTFSCIVEDGKIVGFHGRCGLYVDSIGVYITQNQH